LHHPIVTSTISDTKKYAQLIYKERKSLSRELGCVTTFRKRASENQQFQLVNVRAE
jgi:hypothetical protein